MIMYTYQKMLEKAKEKGLTSEALMWSGIKEVDKMLCVIKEVEPQMYWNFLRSQHKALYKGHYDQDYADYDLSQIYYTDKSGMKRSGPYWPLEKIEEATKAMNFPNGTNKWDIYVAFNVFKSDLAKALNDEEVIRGAHEFFFQDEDFKKEGTTKLWEYMDSVR